MILPFSDPKPGEAGWAQCLGIATRWVMAKIEVVQGERAISRAMEARCSTRGESLVSVAAMAVENQLAFREANRAGHLRFGSFSVSTFFGQNFWADQSTWPWKASSLQRMGPSVGSATTFTPEEIEERESNRKDRLLDFHETNADRIEGLAYFARAAEFAGRLREIAAEDEGLDVIDRKLSALDDEMFLALLDELQGEAGTNAALAPVYRQVEADLASSQGKLNAQQLATVKAQSMHRRLYEHVGLLRLSLFYMPDV